MAIKIFAVIDRSTGAVIRVEQKMAATTEYFGSDFYDVDITSLQAAAPLPGYIYDGSTFSSAPSAPTRPTLVITAIAADEAHAASVIIADDFSEITCPIGTVLTATVHLVDGTNYIIPLTTPVPFRMPRRASDGRERVKSAAFNNGVAVIVLTMDEGGIWMIDEGLINRALLSDQQMAFGGITMYVEG